MARADEADQATKVTFDQPAQIAGRVLPAGTYWLVLPQKVTQQYLVRIFSSDRTTLYATLFTISAERPGRSHHLALTFGERGSAQLQAIVTWFYPSDTTGRDLRDNIVSPPLYDEVQDLTDGVRLAQQRDAVAFKRYYRLHSRNVHRTRLPIVGATAAAEELAQICQDSYKVPDRQFEGSLSGLASWAWAR